ncbi:MAG: hypothetical protein HY780_15415 [Chloroflexi bacterium]|nr:hypothetical protein [Chloroflexota bacterium]
MLVLDLRAAVLGVLLVLLSSILLALWLDRHFWRKSSSSVVLAPSDSSEARLRPILNDLAHEFRTPLAVLLVHLEVLRSPDIAPETTQESIRLMRAELRRMSQMVNHILDLGELEMKGLYARHPVNMRTAAAEILAEMTPLANEREIQLSLNADTQALWVNGDSYRLKQVLLNLVDNAVKYSRPQDRVEISLQYDDARKKILCAVCDTGPGIAVEHLPHLTRRFYRGVSEAIGGSGLGLAVVAAILKLHASALEIETSTQGDTTGTCMRFALDIAPEMEQNV